MSAYRRFVAYVYEYQKEQKKENRGFIKVEARGGECVMDIRLQCPNLAPEQKCRIYGFVRKKQDLMGVFLGECQTAPGMIEYRIRTRADRLNGQQAGLEDLGGMVLLLDGGAFYGTQWDDAPISPLAFQVPKIEEAAAEAVQDENAPLSNPELDREMQLEGGEGAGEEASQETEEEALEAQAAENSPEDLPPEREALEAKAPEAEDSVKEGQEEDASLDMVLTEAVEIQGESEKNFPSESIRAVEGTLQETEMRTGVQEALTQAELAVEAYSEKETGTGATNIEEKEQGKAEPEIEESKKTEIEAEELGGAGPEIEGSKRPGPKIGESKGPESQIEESKMQESEFEEREKTETKPEEMEIEEAAATAEKIVPIPPSPRRSRRTEPEAWEEEPEDRSVHTAEALLEEVHRVPERKEWKGFWPFDDGEITDCVKITHQDFPKLHKRDWALKNNRFLLYGYQHFGYLLLGKLRGTDQYVLGVPGLYDQQERFMANMFGFPHFKASRTLQLETGRGGYWYRMIGTPSQELQNRRR